MNCEIDFIRIVSVKSLRVLPSVLLSSPIRTASFELDMTGAEESDDHATMIDRYSQERAGRLSHAGVDVLRHRVEVAHRALSRALSHSCEKRSARDAANVILLAAGQNLRRIENIHNWRCHEARIAVPYSSNALNKCDQ
jgi:hypothetical protein